MKMRSFAVLPLLLLASCASYTPRPGEPTALLRFVSYSREHSLLLIQDNAACPNHRPLFMKQISGGMGKEKKSLGMAGAAASDAFDFYETPVPAGPELLMMMMSTALYPHKTGYQCRVGIAFAPRKDGQYEVQYAGDEIGCTGRIYELVADVNGKVTRRPEATARPLQLDPSSGKLCQYQRAP